MSTRTLLPTLLLITLAEPMPAQLAQRPSSIAVSLDGSVHLGGPGCHVRRFGTEEAADIAGCEGGITSVAVDRQGHIHAASPTQIFEATPGGDFRLISDGWLGIGGIAAGLDGEVWAATGDGVYRVRGAGREKLWAGGARKIAADPVRGDVFFISKDSVFRLTADGATELEGAPKNGASIAVDATGNVYVSGEGGLWKRDPAGNWEELSPESPAAVACEVNGGLILVNIDGAVDSLSPRKGRTQIEKAAALEPLEAAPTGAIAHWRFEELSGPTSADSSGNGNAGTWAGSVSGSTFGKVNNAVSIGPGGRIDVPVSGPSHPLRAVTSFTIAGWVRPGGSNAFRPVMGLDTGSLDYYRLDIQDYNLPGQPSIVLSIFTNQGSLTVTAQTTFAINNWYHIAAKFDAAAGQMKLYLDGAPVATRTVPTGTALEWLTYGNGNVYIGGDGGGSLAGGLDELYFYNRALSDTEVADVMTATGGSADFTSMTVSPNPNFAHDPGFAYRVDLGLGGPAPTGGLPVQLTAEPSNLLDSPIVALPFAAGATATSAEVRVRRTRATSPTNLRLTAVVGGVARFVDINVLPPSIQFAGYRGPATPNASTFNNTVTALYSGRPTTNDFDPPEFQTAIGIQLDVRRGDLIPTTVTSSDVATVPNLSFNSVVFPPGDIQQGWAQYSFPTLPTSRTVTLTYQLTGYSSSAFVRNFTVIPPWARPIAPTTIVGGTAGTGDVQLRAGEFGGTLYAHGQAFQVALSSNNPALTVPPNVTVPIGSTTATFAITTNTVASNQTARITATTASGSMFWDVTVTPAASLPTPQSLTLAPNTVTAGSSSSATVTLSGPAPAGGALVTLSSNNAAASVPANVTVLAGATTANFTVNTSGTSAASASIGAQYNSSNVSATLTINAPGGGGGGAGLIGWWKFDEGSSNTASDSSGNGNTAIFGGSPLPTWTSGQAGQGMQTSSGGYAEAGPAAILRNLTAVTASAWIKPGLVNNFPTLLSWDSGSWDLYSLSIKDSGFAPQQGVYFNVRTDKGLVTAFAPKTDWNSTAWYLVTGTFDPVSGIARLYINGVEGGQATAPAGAVMQNSLFGLQKLFIGGEPGYGYTGGLDDARVYNRALSASEVQALFNPSSGGPSFTSMTIALDPAFNHTQEPNYAYVATLNLSGPAPAGGLPISLTGAPSNLLAQPLSVTPFAQGESSKAIPFRVSRGAATSPATLQLTGVVSGTTRTAGVTVQPPGIRCAGYRGPATPSSASFCDSSVTTVYAGRATTNDFDPPEYQTAIGLTLDTLRGPTIPATVSSSDPSVVPNLGFNVGGLPGSPQTGWSNYSFPTLPTARTVTLNFQLTGYSTPVANRVLNVVPPTPLLALLPTTISGGSSGQGAVELRAGAGPRMYAHGQAFQVGLASNNAALTVPATVTVPVGSYSIAFTVNTAAVTSNQTARITATTPSGTNFFDVTITPVTPGPSIQSISLNPATITSVQTSTGTVTLTGPAPSGGALVTLTNGNPTAASIPPNVTVPSGMTSATFSISPNAVVSTQTTLITGTYNGSANATLTVNPSGGGGGAGLIGWWKFDEGSNNSAADSGSTGAPGTILGSPAWIAGRAGQAISLNGNGLQYVDVGTAPAFKSVTSVTVSAWVKPTGSNDNKPVIVWDSGSWDFYSLTLKDGGTASLQGATFTIRTASGPRSAFVNQTGWDPTRWYRLTGTYHAATATLVVYIDAAAGTPVVLPPGTQMEAGAWGTQKLLLGGEPGWSLSGGLDDARVYNRALTAAEVAALAQ